MELMEWTTVQDTNCIWMYFYQTLGGPAKNMTTHQFMKLFTEPLELVTLNPAMK